MKSVDGGSVGGGHRSSSGNGGRGDRFFCRRTRENRLRLAPVMVAVGDHHVKTPVAALFFGLDQTERVQIEQVAFDKTNLFFRKASAVEIDSEAGKMRRCGVAFCWSGIAVVTSQSLLSLDGPDGRIDLDLGVELAVVGFGKVLEKIARPGTAIATRRIKAAFNLQRLALLNGYQCTRGLERFEFGVVLNAGQIAAVDFCVLPDQGIARRTEHRIPEDAAEVTQDPVATVDPA